LWLAAIVFSLLTGSLGALSMHLLGLYEGALMRAQERLLRDEQRLEEVSGRLRVLEGSVAVWQSQKPPGGVLGGQGPLQAPQWRIVPDGDKK
jgi:hypothetical protein